MGGGFTSETNDKVWSMLSETLGNLDKLVSGGLEEATAIAFRDFASRLVAPAFKKLGWQTQPGDDDNTKKLRTLLTKLVAKYCYKDAAFAADAKKYWEAFSKAPADPASLGADIRGAVLQLVMKSEGSAQLFDQYQKAHSEVEDNAIKNDIYIAIFGALTPELSARALAWSLTDDVRSQDMIYLPMSVSMNGKAGCQECFDWVKNDYERIYGRLGATSMMLFQHIARFGGGFLSEEKAAEVEEFWKSKPVYSSLSKAVAQTCELIRANTAFLGRLSQSDAAKPAAWSGSRL